MKRRSRSDSHGQDDLWNWAGRQPGVIAETPSAAPEKSGPASPGHRDGLIRRLLGGLSQRTIRTH
ncbi:MAG TPA: hypothetical protein PLS03_02065 [Terrimicrobiaceae bacterium]|nr:hypothetical protein [Terrimicrobiaceae bacterium]